METSQQESTTRQNDIAKLLGRLSEQYEMILAQSLADGQRTDTVEQSVKNLSKVIAMQNPENSDIESQ